MYSCLWAILVALVHLLYLHPSVLPSLAVSSTLLPLLFLYPLIIWHPKHLVAMSSTVKWPLCRKTYFPFLLNCFVGFPLNFSCYEKKWIISYSSFHSAHRYSCFHTSPPVLLTVPIFFSLYTLFLFTTYCIFWVYTNSCREKGNSRAGCNAQGTGELWVYMAEQQNFFCWILSAFLTAAECCADVFKELLTIMTRLFVRSGDS